MLVGLVPEVGLEPTHGCPWQILSLLCLPIPPHRHRRAAGVALCQIVFSVASRLAILGRMDDSA